MRKFYGGAVCDCFMASHLRCSMSSNFQSSMGCAINFNYSLLSTHYSLIKSFPFSVFPLPTHLEQRFEIIVNNLSINCPILVALFVGKALTLYR